MFIWSFSKPTSGYNSCMRSSTSVKLPCARGVALSAAVLAFALACACMVASACAIAATQQAQAPALGSAKLAEVTVEGSKKITPEEVTAACGLKLGADVSKDDLQAAANKLAQLGTFGSVSFHYETKPDGVHLHFTVQNVIQKIGKYEIVSVLGQGGMGTVYKARDPFIGRLVALKTINPELVSDPDILKRFYREAQSAGTLQHPNIVTIYDLGEADGRPYIAMAFVEGESLQSIINRRARIPVAVKLKLAQQFCEGLSHAHKHGFVHRDVKPANILVGNDGNVQVVDFGIVRLEATNLTKTGMFMGTIHYASPEQISDGHVDSRSDLWSVACVIYEFLAYKKAFDGSNIAAIVTKVLYSEPDPLSVCAPDIPTELDKVISKGLKKNVEERYQSLDEMLGDLLPIARGMQQSFIGDLILVARDLCEKGNFDAAQEKVRAVLILDNTHGEARRLSSEISQELHRLMPAVKARKMVAEAEQAFSRGEYAEAIRILGQAQELNPADTLARNLKEKALHEQERVQQLREALTQGQSAMKIGDLTEAEQALRRVLELDASNPQAAELLEQIRRDRLARERDFRMKEVLWQADNLVSAGSYDDAQALLLTLQEEFPTAEEIQLKLQILDPLIRSRQFVKEGQRAFNQGQYAEAVEVLTKALELNPGDTEARDLKESALQNRERIRQVRESLGNSQRAMRQGDESNAELELQKVLQLDPANTQATSLLGQIRQARAARERELRFQQALQQSGGLIAEGKFDDAQRALLELQREFPDSTEIDQELLEIDQQLKLRRLLSEAQQAFDQREFGEAVRILTEAQDLDPRNERVRDLKVRAVQERDRLRQVREAVSAGQRAMHKGDSAVAERECQRALQLDPGNAQAASLLSQIQNDRRARERAQRLQEGLNHAEKLLSRKKFDEAQRKLAELQQEFPEAEGVQQKLHVLEQRRAEAAPPTPSPAPKAPIEGTPPRAVPANEFAKSMELAEELRRSLETPRKPEPLPTSMAPAPAFVPAIPIVQPPASAAPAEEVPIPGLAGDEHGVTLMMSTLPVPAVQQGAADSFPPPPSPASRVPEPQVQVPPPSPAPSRAEPKQPSRAAALPRVMPVPAPGVKPESPKISPMMIGAAVVVLVVILSVGGYMVFRNHPQGGTATQPSATAPSVSSPEQQEKDLFDRARIAEDAKNWGEAIAQYNKVAELNGPMKAEALQHIQQIRENNAKEIARNEKDTFQQASATLKEKRVLPGAAPLPECHWPKSPRIRLSLRRRKRNWKSLNLFCVTRRNLTRLRTLRIRDNCKTRSQNSRP